MVAVSIAAWLGILVFMSGMDDGPGTPLHNLPVFLAGWIVMLTAMMLPSELNYIGGFLAVLKSRGVARPARARLAAGFVSGYGIAWIAYGLLAYLLDAVVRAYSPAFVAWDKAGPALAGLVLFGAGLYQVSSLKQACLRSCRSPLAFFARYWRKNLVGAIGMGTRHGLVCVGCCWALMGVMFVVGTMSLTWMSLLTVLMFAEKVLPGGQRLRFPIAGLLWVMGLWIGVSPNTAPLLKQPMMFASICGML